MPGERLATLFVRRFGPDVESEPVSSRPNEWGDTHSHGLRRRARWASKDTDYRRPRWAAADTGRDDLCAGAGRKRTLDEIASLPHTAVLYESANRLVDTLGEIETRAGAARPAAVAREMTKQFEEVRRGTVSQLRAYYKDKPPRGEVVLVLERAAIRVPGRPPFVDLQTLFFRQTPDYGPEPYDDLALGRRRQSRGLRHKSV